MLFRSCTAAAASEVPKTQANGTPWVLISQRDAARECASLGKGYHLVSNHEWLTIGANIANVASNWSSGTVGTGSLARGHSDDSPTYVCPASSTDANAFVESDCTPLAAGGGEEDEATQRRTHTLSNGKVIWDFAGNVWEWTSYYNATEKPGPLTSSFHEFSTVTGTTSMQVSELIPSQEAFWKSSWSSAEAIGTYKAGTDNNIGALLRGGHWNSTTNAGIFSASLQEGPTNTYASTSYGFRCAIEVP